MAKKGKKYRAALEKFEPNKKYSLEDGINTVKEIAFAKFDETKITNCRDVALCVVDLSAFRFD